MPPLNVLFLCTGNLCRSVIGAAVLEEHARARGVAVRVDSAGLATEGVGPPRAVVNLLRARGIDVSSHRSRLLDAALVADADLVVGAAREHAWEAVALRPSAIDRVFTVRELARLVRMVGMPTEGEQLASWTERLHACRSTLGPASVGDDIEDPLHRRRAVYERVACELHEFAAVLVEALARFDAPLPAHPRCTGATRFPSGGAEPR